MDIEAYIRQSKLSLKEDASPLDGGSKSKLKLGLFSYPVLQAADILVHRATHVPVGEDQSQHLEFARECVTNFNHAYGSHLVFPQTIMCMLPASFEESAAILMRCSPGEASNVPPRASSQNVKITRRPSIKDFDHRQCGGNLPQSHGCPHRFHELRLV